jgi:predicted RNA-binding Zn-ribbon protein involved in translation (DUF1610 family)
MVSPDKVAVCLSCGNEWEVRKAGVGTKRKCPLCGKYKVKMKSEVKADGSKPDSTDPVDSSPGNVPVPADAEDSGMDDATPDGMGEESRRKEENSPTSPETSPRSPVTSPDFSSGEKGEEKTETAGSGIITYAALLLLAVGAGWFLVGLFRRRRAPPVDKSAEVERINHRVPAFPGF